MRGVARRGRSGVEVDRWIVDEDKGVVRFVGVDVSTCFTNTDIEL